MLLAEVVAASSDVAATSSRKAKIERLAGLLRGVPAPEIVPVVAWLTGELRQRQIGVGYASLRELPPAAEEPTLGVAEVDVDLRDDRSPVRAGIAGQPADVAGPGCSAGPRPRNSGS